MRQLVLTAPDVVLLDQNLPGKSGQELARWLMTRCPLPIVLFTSAWSESLRRRAMEQGAIEVLAKPSSMDHQDGFWDKLMNTLINAWRAPVRRLQRPPGRAVVVGIAVSTGGPPVVKQVLSELPEAMPPIVIVQHMREGFLAAFASQLDDASPLRVKLASDGEDLKPGWAYVAPPNHQTLVVGQQGRMELKLGPGDPVSGHVPSGDVLLSSIAWTVGGRGVGVVLTGMGHDGAAGLLAMRRAGAPTIAQDRETSTVYGMPKAAADNGGAAKIVPLGGISRAILAAVEPG